MKTALKRSNLSDSFLAAKYRFTPYMACEHGCLYCDGRAERYYVEGQFDRDIVVRDNVPERLLGELPKQRETGFIAVGSGITDAYQPIEARLQLTRRCAEVLAEHDFPVVILTKSALIQRDLEIWSRVHERNGFMLLVSLTFTDDDLRRTFEPRAASVDERLETLRVFRESGCHVGVLAMPFIPRVGDGEDQIRALYEQVAAIGVDWMMPAGMTLRPGRQKDVLMALMGRAYPQLVPDLLEIYGEERASGSPRAAYHRALRQRLAAVGRDFGIPPLVPHRIYRDRLLLYDEINVLLMHMIELYEGRGVDVARLRRGKDRYLAWLEPRKRDYNRRRSQPYGNLEEELRELIRSGRLEETLDNPKLAAFVAEVALERKIFDYVDLATRGASND